MRTGDLMVRVALDLIEVQQRGGKSAEWAAAALAALRQVETELPPMTIEHQFPEREPRDPWRSWFADEGQMLGNLRLVSKGRRRPGGGASRD
jgi:hypothetical protein